MTASDVDNERWRQYAIISSWARPTLMAYVIRIEVPITMCEKAFLTLQQQTDLLCHRANTLIEEGAQQTEAAMEGWRRR